ncbi:hypothetical protein [Falsibacillus albus]|nr:hypothetical protein [Falsibacillus albus]
MNEEEINQLIIKKNIPHQRLMNNILVFNLDYIDWWIDNRKVTQM